jgi:putative flippase GtrA
VARILSRHDPPSNLTPRTVVDADRNLPERDRPVSDTRHWSRHWGGFILSGGTAAIVDAALTLALIHWADFNPFLARFIAIAIAMVVAWLMHRRLTFAVPAPPSLHEFMRFAAVAWGANALNYGIYVVTLILFPDLPTLAVIVFSTAVATVFAYLGFRLGVFRQPPPVA